MSFPVTVTKTIGCTNQPIRRGHDSDAKNKEPALILKERTDGCRTITVTEWATTTATEFVTEIQSIVATRTLPVTISLLSTVYDYTTAWVSTTHVFTTTVVSERPVTITKDNTIYATTSTTIYTTLVTTVTTSYPVVSSVPRTATQTVTASDAESVTVSKPADQTVTVSAQPSGITLPGLTPTLPGSTVLTTVTKTLPPSAITVTQERETTTVTQPASTVTEVRTEIRTETLPPSIESLPASTVTMTPILHVSLCPAPTGAAAPLQPDSDLTFGCKPGYVCDPPKPYGCNLWPDPPADNFLCNPRHCVPSPSFTKVTWDQCETSYYPPSNGYFNLNPEAFGLSYDIFQYNIYQQVVDGRTATVTTGNWDSQASLTQWPRQTTQPPLAMRRRTAPEKDERKGCRSYKRGITPSICFDDCNNAYIIALAIGKTDKLCEEHSSFQDSYSSCAQCVLANANNASRAIMDYVRPEFAQFLNFCNGKSPISPSSAAFEAPQPIVTQLPAFKTRTQADTRGPGFTAVSSRLRASPSQVSYSNPASSFSTAAVSSARLPTSPRQQSTAPATHPGKVAALSSSAAVTSNAITTEASADPVTFEAGTSADASTTTTSPVTSSSRNMDAGSSQTPARTPIQATPATGVTESRRPGTAATYPSVNVTSQSLVSAVPTASACRISGHHLVSFAFVTALSSLMF